MNEIRAYFIILAEHTGIQLKIKYQTLNFLLFKTLFIVTYEFLETNNK